MMLLIASLLPSNAGKSVYYSAIWRKLRDTWMSMTLLLLIAYKLKPGNLQSTSQPLLLTINNHMKS